MSSVMVSLVSSAIVLFLLAFAACAYWQIGNRAMRAGTRILAAIRRRIYARDLRQSVGDDTAVAGQYGTALGREVCAEIDDVVWSHRGLSDRLMNESTRRLWPSDRHRVPPWVVPPEHGRVPPEHFRVQPSPFEWEAGAHSAEQERAE